MNKIMNTAHICKRGLMMLGLAAAVLTANAQVFEQYVKQTGGSYNGNGQSWETAKNNIQRAIDACDAAITGGQATSAVVYVAEGTYLPTATLGGNASQNQTFLIKEGVTVKGGYATSNTGTDKTLGGATILSGNLASNLNTRFEWNDTKQRFDTEFPENAYHVVSFASKDFDANGHANALTKPAALENVTIQYGRAYSTTTDGHRQEAYGGGVYMVEGATLRNCEVRFCFASRNGAGVYMDGGGQVEDCYIHDNQTLGIGVNFGYGGGVAINAGGKVTRSWISNNVGRMGAGIAFVGDGANANLNMVATASLVANNSATTEAGGVYMMNGGVLNSMSVYRNRCNGSGARINDIVTGRSGGVFCLNGGQIYNSAFWGNSVGASDGKGNNDMQFYAFAKGTSRSQLKNVALSNSDRVNWSYASTSDLVTLAANANDADDIKLTKVTAKTGVIKDLNLKTAFDAKPQSGSLLIGAGKQTVPAAATVAKDLLGNGISPVCDLGAVVAAAGGNIAGATVDGVYTIFVTPNASTSADNNNKYGTSWDNPASNLNDALEHAAAYSAANGNAATKIVVKEGTLIPANSNSTSLRGATLSMVSKCTVEGGYPRELTGTTLSTAQLKRNPMAYPTIITGNIGSDYASNIAHLVTFSGVSNAVFDGFQLRYGNATGDNNKNGAGIYANGGQDNVVKNCVVVGCTAENGAALYLTNAGKMTAENVIFRNNSVVALGGNVTSASKNAIVTVTTSGAELTMKHCDVVNNVGNGVFEQGATLNMQYSVCYANLNKETDNSNNWDGKNGLLLAAPIIKEGGTVNIAQSMFDYYWANPDVTNGDATVSKVLNKTNSASAAGTTAAMCVLKCDPADVTSYPQFKDATRNVGVSTVGDITFYGNDADFTPSNMNPLTNAATSSLGGSDMNGITRTYGGAADIGALENYLTQPYVQLDANGNFVSGAVMYVREYRKADGTIDDNHTTTNPITHDGSSWARAINGNAPYDPNNQYTVTQQNKKIGEKQVQTLVGYKIKSPTGRYLQNNNGNLTTTTTENSATVWTFTASNGSHEVVAGAGSNIKANNGNYWLSTETTTQQTGTITHEVNCSTCSGTGKCQTCGGDGLSGKNNNSMCTDCGGSNGLFGLGKRQGSGDCSNCNGTGKKEVTEPTYETVGTAILKNTSTNLTLNSSSSAYSIKISNYYYYLDGTTLKASESQSTQWSFIPQYETRTEDINETINIYTAKSTAINGLQHAVNTQSSAWTSGDNKEVWVAAGVYAKDNETGDESCFMIRDHVDVYGAFPKIGNPGKTERHPLVSQYVYVEKDESGNDKYAYEDYETIIEPIDKEIKAGVKHRVLGQSWEYNPKKDANAKYDGATWDGFTIRNGVLDAYIFTNPDRNPSRQGGGGAAIYKNVTLRNVIATHNTTIFNGAGSQQDFRAGGIYVDGGTLEACYVINNLLQGWSNGAPRQYGAAYGGGIYMYSGTVYNSVIANNRIFASYADGAAIFIENAHFFNNTIVNNKAEGTSRACGGVAIWTDASRGTESALYVYNSIILNNEGLKLGKIGYKDMAVQNGGQMYLNYCLTENITNKVSGSNKIEFSNCTQTTNFSSLFENTGNYSDRSENNFKNLNLRLKPEAATAINKGLDVPTIKGTTYDLSGYNDMDYTERIKDCRIDIGAYEYNGASEIAPEIIDGVAYFYVSQNGRGTTHANQADNAACWMKIQKVLDAAGRYKYANSGKKVIVKLAGEDSQTSKTMKALYDDEERKDKKGDNITFRYSPRNMSDLTSEDERDYALMVPRGVEVWGGYYVANNSNKNTAGSNEFAESTRSVTNHPTYLDGRYESSDKTQYVYAYHTLVFTEQVFDPEHKPYLTTEASKVANSENSAYNNELEGFLTLNGITQDRAVVDGLFLTGGRANKPENNLSATAATKSYGGAAVVPSFAHVRNCIVEDNKALNGGGALLLEPEALVSGTLLKKNSATNGGAIYFKEVDSPSYGTMARVYTSTIVDNTASGEGGGVWFNNNARINSSVIWGNHCGNMKNVYGAAPEYAGAKFAYNYTAVENVREPGINNLSVSSDNEQGTRFSDLTYYGLDIYSALVNTGTLATDYTSLRTSDALAEKDFMNVARVRDTYNYITIGARAQFMPKDNRLITRLYVDPNQGADLSYSQEEAVRYFEGLNTTNDPVYSQRGSSNGYPMQSLQEAIDYINTKRGTSLASLETQFEIILADGDYWPSLGENAYDPTNFTFIIPDNVKILGGMINTTRKDNKFLGQGSASTATNDVKAKVADNISFTDLIALREGLRTYDDNHNNVIEPWEFAKQSIISGNVINSDQDGTNSKYVVTIGAETSKGVYINGVTIGEGKATGDNGAAILISSKTVPVTLNQCSLVDNVAQNGGAISNASTLSIMNSLFAKNKAENGGAIYSEGTLLATNTLFANNEATGIGGAIYSGKSSGTTTLRLVNCDVVMNQAASSPAIYTTGTANNQVLNGVFWGNVATNGDKTIINDAATSVKFTAYESGCGPEATITNDERAVAANIGTNNLVSGSLTQNSNLIISSENDDLDGPNFGNPSAQAGVNGYTPDADFMPYRENRLVDAGWGWIEQDAKGSAYGSGKGGAYALVHDATADELAIGEETYIKDEMRRISLNPTPGAGTKAYIDLGVYELVKVPLQVAGICVDELWVSTEEKLDNGAPDGSSWLTPTTNLQAAINTLLASRCGHHKILHVMEGEYFPVAYDTDGLHQNFVINTGAQNELANDDGYNNHKSGEDLTPTDSEGNPRKDKNGNNIVYKFGDPNAKAFRGIASLTIIGGYSKDISETVNVKEERSGEILEVRQGVRDGEKYETLLTSKYGSTNHIINISDARQWYGYGKIEKIPVYEPNIPHLIEDIAGLEKPTVVPIAIDGITFKNTLSDGDGVGVNYATMQYQTESNGTIYYGLSTQTAANTYDCDPAKIGGTVMPKLTLSHVKMSESGQTASSSALYVGQGGGKTLVLNTLINDNKGNSIKGVATHVVESTIAKNGGKLVLDDNSSVFGSLLWMNASGETEGVTDLKWNAISGIAEDATNHNTPLDNNNKNIAGPNFKDPENKDYHLSASAKTMNIVAWADYATKLNNILGASAINSTFDNDANNNKMKAWLMNPNAYVKQDLAYVFRLLPVNVERGAYEFQQNANRVLYFDPNIVSAADADGLSWEKAFGGGNLQATINLASLYAQQHSGQQAYVYARGGNATNEEITLANGVSLYGSLSRSFEELCENDAANRNEQNIDNKEAESYESLVRQTRPGLAGPNTNRTIVKAIKFAGQLSGISLVDGVEVNGNVDINPTDVVNNGVAVVRNTIVHDAQSFTAKNALLYNVLLRDNSANLALGTNTYAVHVTTDKALGGSNNTNTFFSNIAYTGSQYKWAAPYLNLNYQLDEASNMIDATEAGNPFTGHATASNLAQFINFATDRDVLGNPRTLNDKRDLGCFEMWKVAGSADQLAWYEQETLYNKANASGASTKASKVWRYNPHAGSYVYIMNGLSLVLDETLLNVPEASGNKVENYQMMPGFLLVEEGSSLYGQGNIVKVPYIATEQTIRAEGNLVALPYKHDYDLTVAGSSDPALKISDGGALIYSGDDRAAWKYNSNIMALANGAESKCWKTAEGMVPANEGVYYSAATGTHRFTSKGASFDDSEMLYTENGASKNVTLTQYNHLYDGSVSISNGQLTAKEDMGWNLFGIPYLVSAYKPYQKVADEDYYMMQLPKELWLYYNGTASPDGETTSTNGAGFYAVNSWDAGTWHQASTDTPRLWVGEGFFAQTATIKDKEEIVFQFPIYDGTLTRPSTAPEFRNTRWIVKDSIEEVAPDQDGMIFDLQGRRIQEPQHGKVYLINGKKMMFE